MINRKLAIPIDIVVLNLIGLSAIGFSLDRLNLPFIQVFYALPLALIVPGYAITRAGFPAGIIKPGQRLLLALGFSLTVDVLFGLALNWTPWGLQPLSWAITLELIIFIASILTNYRDRDAWQTGFDTRSFHRLRSREVLLVALAGLVVVTALVVASLGANQQTAGFTQLWILPSQDVANPQQEIVQLGIKSLELEPVRYRLQLKIQDEIIQEWPTIELVPGQSWEKFTNLNLTNLNFPILDAVLYRLDEPDKVYRLVSLKRTLENSGQK